ncbi:SGNH/GDSL hydrolase family protein [bacterium]|nr:SGNH/GDSL hydrolase family protein [bacterium]MCI0607053.1 SGNH/GDSL hydrolase family protein [bacterium]
MEFSKAKKIIYSFIIVSFLFLSAEGLLRLLRVKFQARYSNLAGRLWMRGGVMQDPDLPWSWMPQPGAICHIDGKTDFRFNSLGYRGPVFTIEKPSDTLRIVCMGDSGTMGWKVGDNETYCTLLPSLIEKKSGIKVETINAGVFGYTSHQGLNQLKRRILPLRPDIITFCYNWNDHAGAIQMFGSGGKGVQKPDRDLPAKKRLWALVALSHLKTFQFLENAILKAEAFAARDINDEGVGTTDPASKIRRVPPDHYRQNLVTMIQIARANKITPVLVTQPFNPKVGPKRKIHRAIQKIYNEIVIEVANKEKVLLVDPRPSLETDVAHFTSNTHPSVSGHKKIARLVANAISNSLRSNLLKSFHCSTYPRAFKFSRTASSSCGVSIF